MNTGAQRPTEGEGAARAATGKGERPPAADVVAEHRELLFSIAYRMLGTVADAEDVVQDAWLRWSSADRSGVADPKAYLVRIVTNLAVDRMRSVRARRESYVGPWLPEPLLTSPDVADRVEMSESVSIALLVVLETLSPLERAVFVLREVFGYPHADIAAALDRSEASVRQLAHRARSHVHARRPRFPTDPAEHRRVTAEFLAAMLDGELERLMKVLAPDVTLWTDGGGKVRAARRVVHGADRVARWLAGILRESYEGIAVAEMTARPAEINGVQGLVFSWGDRLISAVTTEVVAGRVRGVHIVANPDKLRALAEGRTLSI
jgi:RNA polymerase sigma-70 factor (TIGR02957 family)